jgi:putative lipoic acid-binding regulatory protein
MVFNPENKKPQIDYPCKWPYKIIGESVAEMISAVEEVVIDLEYDLTPSNISKKGKYFSLNITVVVPSEVVRDLIFQKLTKHPAIKFVI